MIDLAIIVPSIREYRIQRLYNSILQSIKKYSFKVIICGPYDASKYFDCITLNTYASPNRCVQQAVVELTEDCQLIKWSTDDAVYFPDCLDNLVQKMYDHPNHFGICKYSEDGPPGWPSGKDDIYYLAKTHGDMKDLRGIKDSYMIAPVGIYYRKNFIELGGLDCAYEHINMSTHDLAFRCQEYGISPIISDSVIMHCDSNNTLPEHHPLDIAHHNNDYPIFYSKYNQQNPININNSIIDINNYKKYQDIWRRFK